MQNEAKHIGILGLLFCFLIALAGITESKGEFKIITLEKEIDPESGMEYQAIPLSLNTTKNGRLYVNTYGDIRIYETSTGKHINTFKFAAIKRGGCGTSGSNRNKLEFTNNEKIIYRRVGCGFGKINTVDMFYKELLFIEKGVFLHSFSVSPDEKLLAVSTSDCILCVWDIEKQQYIFENKLKSEESGGISFSPNGELIVVSDIGVWNKKQNNFRNFAFTYNSEQATYAYNSATTIYFLSNNEHIISAGNSSKYAVIKDIFTGKIINRFSHGVKINAVAISPDEKLIATGGLDDKRIQLFDAKTGKRLRTFEGHTNLIKGLAFSKDGKKLISSSLDHTIRIWNLK